MNNLKLSLLKKWELDSELSFVHGSVLLPDGTAIILTTGEKSDWGKFYLLVLSVDGIKKIPIEYAETSGRDYPCDKGPKITLHKSKRPISDKNL